MRPLLYTTIAALSLSVVGCDQPKPASVEGVYLAQADGIYTPPEGDTIVVSDGVPEISDDLGDVVRVAFGKNVTWDVVEDTLAELEARTKDVHLLVGDRDDIKAFRLSDELEGHAMRLVGELKGKACVAPPGVIEAKCVQRPDEKNMSRAYVRQLTREAMRGYGLHDVEVYVPRELDWANVVRLIDGARTCCGESAMRVAVVEEPPETP